MTACDPKETFALKLLLAPILALSLFACGHTPTYEQVAMGLEGPDFPSDGHGFIRRWIPSGADYTYEVSTDEMANIRIALSSCVSRFQKDVYPTPDVTTVTAQLLQCMEEKTWFLSIEEIVVTD